ncbi:uncharacterized protein LOC141590006 [Silene latifolia]|uniref:uncharacterized protein LOC141590006 n=1 Tax=Silene latifolia TaxID=37657 RepID=UPI003D76E711
MYCLVKKMQQLKPQFRQYNRDFFSDIENSVVLALKNMGYIQAQLAIDPRDTMCLQKEKNAIGEYKELQSANDLFLSQKAKTAWIKDEYFNTKYFHGVIRSNFMRNQVLSITDMNGQEHEDPQKDSEFLFIVLHSVVRDRETNYNKAPGPDGFSSAFFKDSWKIIGDEVCDIVQDFFHSGKFLKQLNSTILTLIPKCKMPTQGGFIKGRSIIENILVCQDLVGLYNKKNSSPRCMFKMDLMKAYDSGDISSIMVILRAYSDFSVASGLNMDAQKSYAYFNGVSEDLKRDILFVSGFMEGRLPFKYLGVPITAGRLKKKDCAVLIDNIVDKIKNLGAKRLSYASSLVLNIDDDKGWGIIEEMATHCAEYRNPRGGIRMVSSVDSAVVAQLEVMNARFDKFELQAAGDQQTVHLLTRQEPFHVRDVEAMMVTLLLTV